MPNAKYSEIRLGIAAALSADLGFEFLDYSPIDNSFFDTLPRGLVDFDSSDDFIWQPGSGIDLEQVPIMVEIYAAIEADDTSGRNASVKIADYLTDAEDTLRHLRSMSGQVDQVTVIRSKVEGLAVQLTETGVKARFAWVQASISLSRK